MKPVVYDGKEDWEEYLSRFEIVADINRLDVKEKGLYLAGSLAGAARAVLSDLDTESRRDFTQLTSSLQRRFGSECKSEMFRAKLQTRVKGKEESISDLSRAIRKLTRQAYPKAQQQVLETLSVDYFIDAIVDPDIRLRLREAQLETLTQAETLAVRLESYKLADKFRNRPVRAVEGMGDVAKALDDKSACASNAPPNEKLVQSLRSEIESLKKKVESKDGNRSGQGQSGRSSHRGNLNPKWSNQNGGNSQKGHINAEANRNSENSKKPDSRAVARK
ncbi:uncharacterized protein LOC132552764 [Ylistrum balloti]|uniref:uncharacterized protein LOC132552764 n=1 Tax=Ylistrum balloti TaxID=509963 RepID=UPI002905B223|nr:uncharacterized protein LOC132552764 [Ylistrum balloti]